MLSNFVLKCQKMLMSYETLRLSLLFFWGGGGGGGETAIKYLWQNICKAGLVKGISGWNIFLFFLYKITIEKKNTHFKTLLMTFETIFQYKVYSMTWILKKLCTHAIVLRLRSCLFCEGRISVLKRWFKTPIQNAVNSGYCSSSSEPERRLYDVI